MISDFDKYYRVIETEFHQFCVQRGIHENDYFISISFHLKGKEETAFYIAENEVLQMEFFLAVDEEMCISDLNEKLAELN